MQNDEVKYSESDAIKKLHKELARLMVVPTIASRITTIRRHDNWCAIEFQEIPALDNRCDVNWKNSRIIPAYLKLLGRIIEIDQNHYTSWSFHLEPADSARRALYAQEDEGRARPQIQAMVDANDYLVWLRQDITSMTKDVLGHYGSSFYISDEDYDKRFFSEDEIVLVERSA